MPKPEENLIKPAIIDRHHIVVRGYCHLAILWNVIDLYEDG